VKAAHGFVIRGALGVRELLLIERLQEIDERLDAGRDSRGSRRRAAAWIADEEASGRRRASP
jgi:hypothetical protein